MPDKPEPKELEILLARIEKEWQELVHLLKSQGLPEARVIEVEKLLLRDTEGKYRGKISVNADGSVGLRFIDHEGQAWVWLGVDQNGEVFLELKDRKGEIKFTVPGSLPAPQAGAEAGAPPSAGQPNKDPDSPESPGESPPPATSAASGDTTASGPGQAEPPPPSPEERSGRDANAVILARLEELERRRRRQWWFRAPILALLGLILGTQAYLLSRPHPTGPLQAHSLVIRDANGAVRAELGTLNGKVGLDLWDSRGKRRAVLDLGPDGSPALALYDVDQRPRAELKLGPEGVPKFSLQNSLASAGRAKAKAAPTSSSQPTRPGTVSGSEGGTVASPPAAPPGSLSAPEREAGAKVVYVGSKTSNKYHYPTCKWAQKIRPERLIIFKSVKEAQARHYIPCPVCKPPPLSNNQK
jgi:hypothetical protein